MAEGAGWFNQGYMLILASALANDGGLADEDESNLYFTLVNDASLYPYRQETLDELDEVTKQDDRFTRFPMPRQDKGRVIIFNYDYVQPSYYAVIFRIIAWVVQGDEGFVASHLVMVDRDADDANLLAWWTLGNQVPFTYNNGDEIYIPYAEARWSQ
jgi:hypothetical protein